MAKVFRVIGTVAAIAAPFFPVASAIAAVISQVGLALTAKPPAAVGQINERVIGGNHPLPYLMGRSYSGGIQVHDVGYGGEVDDVQNPYRWFVTVHSCAGPVDAIETTLANFSPVSFSGGEAVGYYANYWWRDEQLGAQPEASALTAHFPTPPRWGSSYKLSGFCAVGHNLQWSKKAKRFAGGQLPLIGQVIRGVKVYDPRLDSTYPGGSGSHRIANEATWAYSRNPALHALAYAYGRYANGVKIFGIDLGGASIDLASAVAWANVCDTNDWYCDGTITEPGNKWENLKRICQAGGGLPVLSGGILRFDFQAPRTALATITRDDLASGPLRDSLGRGFEQRHNTIVPRYRSEAHQWEFVQSDAVSEAAFLTADGEEKRDEIQYDLVTGKDQAAELATYELWQRREAGPINLPLKPHFRSYAPGDAFTLAAELSPTGAAIKVVMRSRSIDVEQARVDCVFEAESDAKHLAAIGSLGTAPASFTFPTGEEMDNAFAFNGESPGEILSLITGRAMLDADPADGLLSATDTSVTIETHTARYADKSVSVTGATLTTLDDGTTAIPASTLLFIYYDDFLRNGGAVAFKATTASATAYSSPDHPARHYVGTITTVAMGDPPATGGGSRPPGWGDEWQTDML